jgi:hypothetical protein
MDIDRFQVRYADQMADVTPVHTADTTQAIFSFLLSSQHDKSELIVRDLIDDIFVDVPEFMQAFEEGECPGDLQFF